MVEIHSKERKTLLAFGTRHVSQLLHQRRLLAPKSTLDDWWVTSLNTHAPTFESPRMGACTMAVRADHFAFLELCGQPLVRHAARPL